jgi:hypothetical protein
MQSIPLLRFWRDIRTGAIAGTVVAVGFIVWRVTREGDLGWTVLSFGVSAALFASVLGAWLWRWVPKHWSKSEPVPADAEVMPSGKARWWALLGGFAFGFAAIGRAADDNVIVAGVLAGLVAGALAGFTAGIVRLQRVQNEHGQELLQWRRGGLRNPRHFLRDLDPRLTSSRGRPTPRRTTIRVADGTLRAGPSESTPDTHATRCRGHA